MTDKELKEHVLDVRLVLGVKDDELPINERNTFEFNQLMIESVGKEAGHPPSDKYGHHDRQHERQIVRYLNLQRHITILFCIINCVVTCIQK